MVEELRIWIDRAESAWLRDLYEHAGNTFRSGSLPSHDHTHHLRVWKLCKSLLNELSMVDSSLDQTLVEGVLIAALFHDLGMAVSIREDHGRLSRKSCEDWFTATGREVPERFEEILTAIERHDQKDEKIYDSFLPGTAPQILGILSVADDLDALGSTGIFRYAEIYLGRGIPLEELGTRVLDNVKRRFERFREGCSLCHSLLERHQEQFEEVLHFYEAYNLQLTETSRADAETDGPLGVINYIRIHGMEHTELEKSGPDVQAFFKKLDEDLAGVPV